MNTTTVDIDVRLIDMRQSDLMQLIQDVVKKTCKELTLEIESRLNRERKPEPTPMHGIEGMAKALGCSKATAQRLKSNGHLEGGYQQIGNSIIINDPQKLREIAERSVRESKKARRGNRVSYSHL